MRRKRDNWDDEVALLYLAIMAGLLIARWAEWLWLE